MRPMRNLAAHLVLKTETFLQERNSSPTRERISNTPAGKVLQSGRVSGIDVTEFWTRKCFATQMIFETCWGGRGRSGAVSDDQEIAVNLQNGRPKVYKVLSVGPIRCRSFPSGRISTPTIPSLVRFGCDWMLPGASLARDQDRDPNLVS
jgi:hypothetical protein